MTHTQDSGFRMQEVPVDVHMEEDGGEGRTPRKRRPVQCYLDSWESPLSALTPSPSPMTGAVRSTVGSKGPLLLQMPQMNEVLKLAESSRRELFGDEEEEGNDNDKEEVQPEEEEGEEGQEEEEDEQGLDKDVEEQPEDEDDESDVNEDYKEEEDEADKEEVMPEKRKGRNYQRLLQLAQDVGKTKMQGRTEQRRPDKGGKFPRATILKEAEKRKADEKK